MDKESIVFMLEEINKYEYRLTRWEVDYIQRMYSLETHSKKQIETIQHIYEKATDIL